MLRRAGVDAPVAVSPGDLVDRLGELAQSSGEMAAVDLLALWPDGDDQSAALVDTLTALEEAGVAFGEEEDLEPVHRRMHVFDLSDIDSDDTVSLYLREVGNIPLLTAEQEVDLAKRIERGREAASGQLTPVLGDHPELIAALIADGEAARHHLTKANSRLVIAMAKKYMNQGVPFLDLIQEGNLGLMKAVEKFDWRRGYKFSTYATWWVRQAITRAIADQGRTIRVPVHMSDRIRRLFQASRRLEQQLGREPATDELATELGVSTDKVEWMLRISRGPLSLERPVGEDQESELGDFIKDDGAPAPPDVAVRTMLRDEIEHMLASLSPREARVLELRYGLLDGRMRTLKEVGEKFGVTRERIRQIETEALERLRNPNRAHRLREFLEAD